MQFKALGLAASVAAIAIGLSSPTMAQRRAGPSLHVQCDGNPDNVSSGETAARLLGAVTLLGLFAPPPEQRNQSARLHGAEGIRVCSDLLTRESNDVRRAQLRLANALHHIEARDFEGAIGQARMVGSERPSLGSSRAFQLSLGLSAYEVEARALLGMNRVRDAANKAMEMADAAPYDLVANLGAASYVALTGEYGEAEQRFYARLMRLLPIAVVYRSNARQMAGDFAGAADDIDLFLTMAESIVDEPPAASIAQLALYRALAGDTARAETHARAAREALDADPTMTGAAAIGELLDLHQILTSARGGNAAQARLLFTGRTRWTFAPSATLGAVARELRQNAPEAELTGSLARDPASFREERLATMITRLRGPEPDSPEQQAEAEGQARDGKSPASEQRLFNAIRPQMTERQLTDYAANTWRTERSRYFNRQTNERMQARFIDVSRNGFGSAAGYAMLLHSALVAKAEGRSSFMFMPGRPSLTAQMVRFGEVGDNLPEPFALNADQVIADLSPLIPRPQRR